MKCPSCHTRIDEDCEFCPKCGKKIIRSIECPNCRAINSPDALFCKKCGTKLVEEQNDNQHVVQQKNSKTIELKKLFHGISMGLSLLLMLLFFGLSFAPFLNNPLLSSNESTIIGFVNDVFSNFGPLSKSRAYLTIASSIVILVLFIAFLGLSTFFIAFAIIKYVNFFTKNKYYNLAKISCIQYVTYFTLFIFFVKFVLSDETILYGANVAGGPMFLLVFFPICLSFNIFVSVFFEEKKQLVNTIVLLTVGILSFIFINIILFNLGGERFITNSEYALLDQSGVQTITAKDYRTVNSYGFTSLLFFLTTYVYSEASSMFIPAVIISIINLLTIFVSILCSSFILSSSLNMAVNRKGKHISVAILSLIDICLSIASIVMCQVACSFANKMNSVPKYALSMVAKANVNSYIPIIILLSFVMFINIFAFVFLKASEKKSKANYENFTEHHD